MRDPSSRLGYWNQVTGTHRKESTDLMSIAKLILFCAALATIGGCRYAPNGDAVSVAPFSESRAQLPGTPCKSVLEKAKLLDESGALALYVAETAEDSAFNKARESEPLDPCRNSLFLRLRRANGADEWRVLLTTGSEWHDAAGMDKWCSDRARDVKNCFYVFKASFSSDGRHLWLVCSPHTYTYSVVCSYDVSNRTFRVLIDGDTAEEQPDGTILAKNKKTYLFDDNGEPLGARFYDAWINPDGEIVRKGKLKTAEEVD